MGSIADRLYLTAIPAGSSPQEAAALELAAVKTWLRVDGDALDGAIRDAIDEAKAEADAFCANPFTVINPLTAEIIVLPVPFGVRTWVRERVARLIQNPTGAASIAVTGVSTVAWSTPTFEGLYPYRRLPGL